jgi:hypothetical protein
MTESTALRLADEISKPWYRWQAQAEAAAELPRLHALNREMLEALKAITTAPDLTTLGLALAMARAAIARAEGKV